MRMTAGQEVEKIETKLRQLGGKLDGLASLGVEMVDDAHVEYRKQIEHTKDMSGGLVAVVESYRGKAVLALTLRRGGSQPSLARRPSRLGESP